MKYFIEFIPSLHIHFNDEEFEFISVLTKKDPDIERIWQVKEIHKKYHDNKYPTVLTIYELSGIMKLMETSQVKSIKTGENLALALTEKLMTIMKEALSLKTSINNNGKEIEL